MTEPIEEMIDNAIRDNAVSRDAMRWTPDPTEDHSHELQVTGASEGWNVSGGTARFVTNTTYPTFDPAAHRWLEVRSLAYGAPPARRATSEWVHNGRIEHEPVERITFTMDNSEGRLTPTGRPIAFASEPTGFLHADYRPPVRWYRRFARWIRRSRA